MTMKRSILTTAAVCATAAAGVAAIPAFGATKTVSVKDDFFSPKSLTVPKNTTIKWVWRGDAPHNVKVTSGPVKFTSKLQTSGTYRKKLTRAGLYRIVCTIHDGMTMRIRVR